MVRTGFKRMNRTVFMSSIRSDFSKSNKKFMRVGRSNTPSKTRGFKDHKFAMGGINWY